MIRATADVCSRFVRRFLPDAFLFAAILTFIVFLAGMLGEGQGPIAMVTFWGDGFWGLLEFSMQMVLILVTGHVLAMSRPVKAVLQRIAATARTPGSAIVLVTVVASIACWINWGFGLIVGALLARELAARVRGVHYPLLVASAYTGFLVWHAGLSGSVPLQIASPGDDAIGALLGGRSVPVSETIFSLPVLLIVLVLVATLPLLNRAMLPKPEDTIEVDPSILREEPHLAADPAERTPALRLEYSPLVSMLLGAMGVVYAVAYFAGGGSLGLNSVIFLFLFAGILLHGTPARYLAALQEAVKGAGGIILQFPLYAGIMGMMTQSGLAASISQWFVDVSSPATFPLLTFLSAGLINLFVPSGGGQWAVQAPIVIPAAIELGVPLGKAGMAVAFGDAWTNMVQPFWALPLLAIAGLGIRDIMGYCLLALIWSGIVISVGLLLM